jgi:hypothetical protein
VRVVLAHDGDDAAYTLVQRWADRAILVTASQVAARRLSLRQRGADVRSWMPGTTIDAVVTRLSGVGAGELPHVRSEDRSYAAEETTAFLLAWLDTCPGRVVNRPSPGCLNGPPWRPAQWLRAAARLGLRVRPLQWVVGPPGPRQMPAPPGAQRCAVTVVGPRCLGKGHPVLGAQAVELARAAGTDMLEVLFDSGAPDAAVVTASAWPDVAVPEVADALDEYLG